MALDVVAVDNAKELEKVLRDTLIDREFRQNYKHIYKLVHNPETKDGIIKALTAGGVMKKGSGKITMEVKSSGLNNEITWDNYHKSIEFWLNNNVNSDAMFALAREALARYIFDKHYDVYPYWPDIAAQSICVQVRGKYDWNNDTLIWGAKGQPFVRDVCEKLGDDDNIIRYFCEVWGELELKALDLDRWKLDKFNKMIADKPKEWTEMCEKLKVEKFSVQEMNKSMLSMFSIKR